jgi:tetratricopeptide (TPR) repeat protein
LCAVGRTAEGIPPLEESVAKARTAGSRKRLVDALVALAAARREAGDFDRSAEALREAESAVAAEAEMARSPHAARLEVERARLALARSDPREAVALARSALGRERDPMVPLDTLRFTLALAEAQNGASDFADARDSARRALGMASEGLEQPDSAWLGQARLELGTALAGLGDTDAGRKELQQALGHLGPTVGPNGRSTRRAQAQLQRLDDRSPAAR